MNFQSPYLARLQDLKVWQGSYDSLLQNKSKDSSHSHPSEYETIEGLSVLDSSNDADKPSISIDNDWDKKAISPTKTFAQLLEEKLAEDKPVPAQSKPKKPFLRKGAGLLRYKLGPKAISTKSTQNGILRSTGKRSSSPRHNKSVKVTVDANTEPEVCMIPLKMPDLNVKSKATWSRITNKVESNVCNDSVKRIHNSVSPKFNSPEKRNICRINELAYKHFHDNKNSESLKGHRPRPIDLNKENASMAHTELENTLDKDLRIFETLEERVEHPSFSSTNSSIVRMLISTPRKVKNAFKTIPIREEMQQVSCEPESYLLNPSLAHKIEEVNKKTDVLHEFLNNLRKIADDNTTKKWHFEPTTMVDEKSGTSTNNTSYSETTNTDDTRSQSPSSFYTDFENTLGGNTNNNHCRKTDAAVNTSLIENNTAATEVNAKCLNCEELRKRLDKIQGEIPDIQKEKAKICDFAKELESKRDQLSMEIQRLQMKYDADVSDLREELVVEKRKFAKEKAVFDMYIKESQKMPSKKERDEIMVLKKELTDIKELLKLKEAKNGATQARLRNQIKLLEKEKSEFKAQVESLQKENSKLIAAQKVRRPSEVKMLHEINRNLTKLANKQVTKSDTSNDMKKGNDKNEKRLSNDDIYQKDKDTSPKQRKKSLNAKQRRSSTDMPDDNYSGNVTTFANLSLEKEYENVFGNSPKSEMQTTSLNESRKGKTETIFPDGSKQIKYSNGNSKTISPDGKMIVVQYYNGDIKETNLVENTIKYYYAENNTWQTQFDDGSELLEYSNGQKEKKCKDGRKEVTCPDGTQFIRFVDGTEEVHYPDGSKMVKNENGDKVLLLPNGQKEIHSKDHKRREYPDGTVKILYPDGTQETRYSSGRVRIKDANGVLILDSED